MIVGIDWSSIDSTQLSHNFKTFVHDLIDAREFFRRANLSFDEINQIHLVSFDQVCFCEQLFKLFLRDIHAQRLPSFDFRVPQLLTVLVEFLVFIF